MQQVKSLHNKLKAPILKEGRSELSYLSILEKDLKNQHKN